MVGLFSNILIHENVARVLFKSSIIITIILSFGIFRLAIKKSKNTGIKNYIITFICTPLFIFGLVYLSTLRGMPSIIHVLISSESSMKVTTLKRSSIYRSKHCKGKVYIQGYSLFLNDRICKIQKGVWNDLEHNDSLLLTGNSSFLGFTYNRYRKLTSDSR